MELVKKPGNSIEGPRKAGTDTISNSRNRVSPSFLPDFGGSHVDFMVQDDFFTRSAVPYSPLFPRGFSGTAFPSANGKGHCAVCSVQSVWKQPKTERRTRNALHPFYLSGTKSALFYVVAGVAADEGKDIVTGDVQARGPHQKLGRVSGFGFVVGCRPSPAEHFCAESASVGREWPA